MIDPSSQTFDLIIIGAGINGAGVARDASLRGLKVLLLDKDDIASGTSSYSTRLIHGGLRYLEHGELGLVRESLRERETLLRIAPHLVRPLPILIPIYSGMRRGRAKIRAGMIVYDLLSLDKSLPRHRTLSAQQTLQTIPTLKSDGLLGAAIYYDAQVEFAERLVLENVLSATDHGATIVTHAPIDGLIIDNKRVTALKYRLRSGETRLAHVGFVVNAAGPWVDRVLEQTNGSEKLIGGTKGSHIIVPPFPGAASMAIYTEAQTDWRPFFIIPWNGNYLIGTTDAQFDADPDGVRTEQWEVDYLLGETNRLFPQANLSRSNILYTYSGVRPLPLTTASEESITRRHFIKRHPHLINLVSIVGGKLTTYRSLAEECVDLVLQKLGKNAVPCRTVDLALPGAEDFNEFVSHFNDKRELFPKAAERLLNIYGSRAGDVVEFSSSAGLLDYLDEEQTILAGEIGFSFEREFAQTLTDCLMRRTMIGFSSHLGLREAESAIRLAKDFKKWNEDEATAELDNYLTSTRRLTVS